MSESARTPGITLHATCVVLGEAGILILGPAGAGKSALARELVATREREGGFARLVADDRVRLRAAAGRLVAGPVPAVAGLIEIRGVGIVRVPYEPACLVRLAVKLDERPDGVRMPEVDALTHHLCGVAVSCLITPFRLAAPLVAWRIRGLSDTIVTET